MLKAIKTAFPLTVPVLLGYLPTGLAFGLMMYNLGYNFLWAGLSCVMIYTGTLQFVLVDVLATGMGMLQVVLISCVLNVRHLVYGLSLLDRFRDKGLHKYHLIYGLSDEAYVLLCSTKAPPGVDDTKFCVALVSLVQSYWVLSTMLGALLGNIIRFNITGIDFAMVALFVVICLEKVLVKINWIPIGVGFACSLLSLLVFGPDNMILPAVIAIVAILLLLRKRLEPPVKEVPLEGEELALALDANGANVEGGGLR